MSFASVRKFGLLLGAAGFLAAGAQAGFIGVRSASAAGPKKAFEEPANAGTEPRFRLLTAAQYANTLTYLFGNDIKIDVQFAPLQRTDGLLALDVSQAGLSDAQLEIYQKVASLVAAQVVNPERRDVLLPCKPADPKAADHACATRFLTEVSRRLYRRPLQDTRIAEMATEADQAADRLKDFYAGIELALEGILVSPNVLFDAEHSEPDPKVPGRERLDAYSLASRLSLFLWNAGPDAMLLNAAEHGDLYKKRDLGRVVDRMLASPRLEASVRAFFDDMFDFDDFSSLAKDPMIYPNFTGLTSADAREQTLRTVVDHLIVKKRDYRDLFTTRDTFISPSLAVIYGIPTNETWMPYSFPPDSPRAGLLTQVSFLALHSHPGRSSPTRRGKALRELLLCQTVPNPPANVDFSAVENSKSPIKTQRERVAIHLKNPVCAGCHRITDPIGLALENFDGAGEYRTTERDGVIDASGSLDGTAFKDAVGLGKTLHDDPALPSCLVKRMYSYAAGGAVTAEDGPLLDYYTEEFAAHGYRLPDLMRTMALSSAFATVHDTKDPPAASPRASAPAP